MFEPCTGSQAEEEDLILQGQVQAEASEWFHFCIYISKTLSPTPESRIGSLGSLVSNPFFSHFFVPSDTF